MGKKLQKKKNILDVIEIVLKSFFYRLNSLKKRCRFLLKKFLKTRFGIILNVSIFKKISFLIKSLIYFIIKFFYFHKKFY